MRFSIVIPTFNEEKYLPLLLRSIKKQTFSDYEIIVSDAESKDRTREIAKKYGCRIVEGGKVSVGRNKGARKARGDILIFFDSDVEIKSKHFLDKVNKRMNNVDVASPYYIAKTNSLFLKLSYFIMNLYIFFTKRWNGCTVGHCTICKKKLHDKINGFDESLVFGEDYEYSQRASKSGKFDVFRDLKIIVSMRRFEKDGWTMIFKAVYATMYRLFIGEIRKPLFKYDFEYEK